MVAVTLGDRERRLARRCARRAVIAGVVYIVTSVCWFVGGYLAGGFFNPFALLSSMVLGGLGIMLGRAGLELLELGRQQSQVELEPIGVVLARIQAVRAALASVPFAVAFAWMLWDLFG
jgi:hypothetical protein